MKLYAGYRPKILSCIYSSVYLYGLGDTVESFKRRLLVFIKVVAGFRFIEKLMFYVTVGLMAILMFLGAGDVIGRYVFNHPITGTQEFSGIFMMAIVMLSWGYTYQKGMHVKVDLFTSHIQPRVREIIFYVISFVTLALFVLLVQQSGNIAMQALHEHRTFPAIKFPTSYFYFLVPVGGSFMCIEIILEILNRMFLKKRSI
jgi:TRAP-type C4-dicarboxylate transport system permease small subunit